ncbi:hypothetical protein HNQ81_000494 [Desulfoprunum benzoelyticum]|uniref:Uncharacterized protein n=1 Tax=Desulfoprunum benzoelyticum TaxID=1506996 RepID=A0A840UKC8_9BACT|nr:hypothetical protein [Desulfoprunum benzoelyticum]
MKDEISRCRFEMTGGRDMTAEEVVDISLGCSYNVITLSI